MDIKPLFQSRTHSYMSWVGARTQSTIKRSPTRFKASWLESQSLARKDFRTRSGRGCIGVLAFLWFLSLTVGFIVLCIFAASSHSISGDSTACLPDDSFNLNPSTYRYWSKSGFFQITMGFGNLNFTQAKAIDVIWDIIIGRGGQGLLALISWRVFVDHVTTSMEIAPVTFNTYRVIFVQNVSLILAIPRILRDFVSRKGLQSKCAMCFIVFSMLLTLIFPTLGSSMTGYSGNVSPYVPDSNGNFIPFKMFSIVMYTVHDGHRIGKEKDFHATVFNDFEPREPILTDLRHWGGYRYRPGASNYKGCEHLTYEYERADCASESIAWNISAYIGQYGAEPTPDTPSTFGDISLNGSTLNITAYAVPSQLNWTRSLSQRLTEQPNVQALYLESNRTYTQYQIEQNGQCQAQKTYQWGFSFVQLNVMIVLLWTWTVGTAIMWTTSKFTMKQRGREDVAGEYKAIFELSEAMQDQLSPGENEEAKSMRQITEMTLRQRISKELQGGAIAYDSSLLSESEADVARDGWTLKGWVKRERWWLVAVAFVTLVDSLAIIAFVSQSRGDLFIFFMLPLAFVFAMYVGTTHQSRGMVLFWTLLVVSVLPAILLGVLWPSLYGIRRY